MRRLTPVLLLAMAGLASSALAQAQSTPADNVPIRKITLYRSGVGYFERTGRIDGDTEIQLRFNTDKINDILKSLVLLDRSGGRIDAVSYGSKEPLARRLASFGVDISSNPSVPDLLNQLRGAPIRVSAGEQVQGTILGIEMRDVPVPKDTPARAEPFLNLVTPGGLKSIAVSGISSFEILDKELAEELNKALAALAEYRADRSKTVNIHFSGQGARDLNGRDVVVAYIHEMPVWKPSYRLILPDESAASAGKKSSVAIQGWAIVENNTDQDWHDVRLALVSGRPVSFQMDLYEPLFVFRPTVPVPTVPGVAPRAYQGGLDAQLGEAVANQARAAEERLAFIAPRAEQAAPAPSMAPGSPREAMKSVMADRGPGGSAGAYRGISSADMSDYAAQAQAAAAEIGEVFQYELDAPVTIERQRSAMIPILSAAISGRRVSIFNLSDSSEHPMRGVEITNDSNLQLLPGPLAVFDSGSGNDAAAKSAYAGDAQIGHISQGDKRLLAYAVDLDVNVLTDTSSTSNITRLKIVNGAFEQTVKSQTRTSYAFKNADAKRARTVVLEQAKLPGWTLVRPEKASEETQTLYRFELPIAAAKTETISVIQERVDAQRAGIMDYDTATILKFHSDGKLSDNVLKTVRDVAARQAANHDIEVAIQELDRQIAEITQDQARIRENMARIDKTSQLYTRYMTKLSDQESKLEELTEQRKKKQGELEKARADLANYINSLNVE